MKIFTEVINGVSSKLRCFSLSVINTPVPITVWAYQRENDIIALQQPA